MSIERSTVGQSIDTNDSASGMHVEGGVGLHIGVHLVRAGMLEATLV